jgi:uncharacterized protein YkwD
MVTPAETDRAQRRRFVALALCIGASCACSAPASATATANVSYAAVSDSSGYLSRLNSERAAHGLRPLIMRSDLTQVAQAWSEHMAATGVLSHNPALATEVTNWLAVGENVGDGPTISDLDAAFMASPKHRANILDPTYDDVGIATVTRNGMIWITVDFRDVERPEPITNDVSQRTAAYVRSPAPTAGSAVASTRSRPVLMLGSTGAAVRVVQRRVHVKADGVFGPITLGAVEVFQRRHRLAVDGIVGARTWAALKPRKTGKHHSAVQRCSGLSLSCLS